MWMIGGCVFGKLTHKRQEALGISKLSYGHRVICKIGTEKYAQKSARNPSKHSPLPIVHTAIRSSNGVMTAITITDRQSSLRDTIAWNKLTKDNLHDNARFYGI